MDYRPSEVKAGIMIVVALVAAVLMLAVLGEWDTLFSQQDVLEMEFDVVSGLEVDNEVLYAGQKIGMVKHIEPILVEPTAEDAKRMGAPEGVDPKTLRLHRIRVYAVVKGGHRFTTGDRAGIDKNLTGKAIIDIRPGAGTFLESTHSSLYPEQDVYVIETSPTVTFNDITTYARQLLEEKGEPLLTSITERVGQIGTVISDNEQQVKALIDKANTAAQTVNDTVASLKEFVDKNRPGVEDTLARVRAAATDLQELTGKAKGVVDEKQLKAIMAEIETASGQLGKLLSEANLKRIESATVDVAQSAAELRGQLNANRRIIKDIFSHVADASMFLSQGLEDLRRNPWRLFYRPRADELEDEYRFQAATALQQGSRRLNNTVSVLERLLQRNDLTPEDKTEIRALLAESRRILETTRKREDALWNKANE